jgi:signal transduction histidine kinase
MRNVALFADLQAQTGRLQAVLDSSADGLVVFDPDGQVLMSNARYSEMFSIGEQLDTAAQRELSVMLKLALEKEQRADFIFTSDHPTSDEQTALEVYAAQVCQGGESIGVVANLRDVTLLHSRERQRSDMLRLAKHEVGTPLAFIEKQAQNMLDLKEHMSDRDRIAALTGISTQAKEVAKLVEETLSYSKLKELLLLKKQTRVDMSQLAQELAQEATVLAEMNQHQFSCQIEPDLQVMGSYHILKRAFRNLLDNARKFTPAGGRISLNVWRDDNSVQVEVADSGIGILPDEQDQIFEPYYRGGDCEGTAGTGLGLSIVQEVVSAHRGKIAVQSVQGEGSRFRVTLLALTPPSQSAATGCQPE